MWASVKTASVVGIKAVVDVGLFVIRVGTRDSVPADIGGTRPGVVPATEYVWRYSVPRGGTVEAPLDGRVDPVRVAFSGVCTYVSVNRATGTYVAFSLFSGGVVTPVGVGPVDAKSRGVEMIMRDSFRNVKEVHGAMVCADMGGMCETWGPCLCYYQVSPDVGLLGFVMVSSLLFLEVCYLVLTRYCMLVVER